MRCSIAARRIGWVALAAFCAGAQSNAMGADMKEAKGMSQNLPAEFSSLRPIRTPQRMEITVGQGEGDLQGKDDKIIQAAVDYVFRLGGGTVRILPGTYTMRNSIFLRSGITLRGSGDRTILKKAPNVSSPVAREADWFEYCLQVADPKGVTPGCGIAVTNKKNEYPAVRFFTVTAIRENVLYLDQRTEKNYWMVDGAKVQTLFSILYGLNADDVRIEDVVLDGTRAQNEYLDGNYGAAVFMQYCNRWAFRNVTERDFNGDGFSFQVCDDVHFENCQGLNNANNGFHAGSGSQRPIFKGCTAKSNLMGLVWCWGVCDGLVEDCTLSENIRCGTNFGHRDTDNVMRNCTLERNGQTGVLFRKLDSERGPGDRNRIEGCLIRDNGSTGECGVDIEWKTTDIAIANCRFENSKDGKQKIAIRISPEAGKITLEGNTFTNCPVEVLDQRGKAVK
jgi:hypothetical protein